MKMATKALLNPKHLYEEAIRQNIAKEDWTRLSDVMMEAEKAGVGKTLRRTGWYHLGLYEAERGNHPAAIAALNFARILDSKPGATLEKIVEEIEAFCQDFNGRFSRQDLYMLAKGLDRVVSFHSFHVKVPRAVQEKGKRLGVWIEDQQQTAPDKEETPATHHVERIYAALYPPLTIEEVRAEFARVVEPLIRERLDRKIKPASGGGGKGPKGPDEEEPKPPEEKPKKGKK
jgi:hypothetical protein